ncbi:MAG: LVIVD repeat-containing protein [Candidatus Heimdallarchaeota archaeon]
MDSNKKRVIISLWVLGLFSLTMFISPFISGYGKIFDNHPITINGLDTYVEDFSTTTYLDGSSTASGWGLGGVLNTRNYTWEHLDFSPTEYAAYGLAVQGRKAYVCCYNELSSFFSVQAFDLNDPANIYRTSYRDSISDAYTCEVDGDNFYIGTSDATIDSYNIQNLFNLGGVGVFLDWYVTDGAVTDIDIEGHLVYYTQYNSTSSGSLGMAYAEDPNALGQITTDWNSNKGLGLDVEGDLAYIAASDEGFYIVNITDKYTTTEYGHVDTPGNATDVLIDGNLAFVADGPGGIQVIGVQNSASPTILGSYNTPGNARRMILQETTLFVADGVGGVQILDVANPAHPLFITELLTTEYVYDVDLMGGILVVTTDEGIHTFRISANWGLADISQTVCDNPFADFQVLDVRVQGNIAYIAGGLDGFYTLDISNPNQPVLLDRFETTPYNVKKLDVDGQFAYLVSDSRVYIFDISDPTDIRETSYISGSQMTDVDIEGELLYMSYETGIAICNVSNSYSWSLIVSYASGNHMNNTAIWVDGRQAFMVEGAGGTINYAFSNYNFNDFSTPTLTDYAGRTLPLYDVHIAGDCAYLGAGGWMSLYNVSDPIAMTYPGWVTTTSWGVWSFGTNVLSAELNNGVAFYDTSDVYSITEISRYPYATAALQITTNGDYTFIANQSSLVILRHFLSAGATFIPGTSFAQSLEVDTVGEIINRATLDAIDYIPAGSSIDYFMTADGGTHWEAVTPGVEHIFANSGNDLRWRAEITGPEDRSSHLYEITIEYSYEEPTSPALPWWAYVIIGGGLVLITLIIITVVVVSKKKKVATR